MPHGYPCGFSFPFIPFRTSFYSSSYTTVRSALHVRLHRPVRPFAQPFTYIGIGLHVHSLSLAHIYASPCTYIGIGLHEYRHRLERLYVYVIRSRPNNVTQYRSGSRTFQRGRRVPKGISAHKLNAISVNFFCTRQLALLPLFAGKSRILN